MKLPRFTSGRVGTLDYKALNQAFTTIEMLESRAGVAPSAFPAPVRESFLATITELMADGVQGAYQTIGEGTIWKTYVYDWVEVDIGYGKTGADSGVGVADLLGARGTSLSIAKAPDSQYPAIDFAPYRRYAVGDVVLLTRVSTRTGSYYSQIYAITPISAVTPFLARLTAIVGTSGAGRYAWTGLSRIIEGTVALKTEATNLYEMNRVSTPGSTSALSVNGVSLNGSANWGHGQSLTPGAGVSITKLPLPVGGVGTGTIVIMHQGHVLESTDGTAFWFYSVAPTTGVCV